MVHYTNISKCHFISRTIEDLEDVILYLELAILWPENYAINFLHMFL